jgi:hypothetical protein
MVRPENHRSMVLDPTTVEAGELPQYDISWLLDPPLDASMLPTRLGSRLSSMVDINHTETALEAR